MPMLMDYIISPLPIRIVGPKVDSSKLQMKNIRITEMGYLPGRTLFRSEVTFDSWAVAYIVGGKGTYSVNTGIEQTINEGTIFFVWPGATFSYGPIKNGYWDEYYIRFEGVRVDEWISVGFLKTDITNIGLDEKLKSKIENIFALMESGIPINSDRAALLLESLIFEFSNANNHKNPDEKSEFFTSVLNDISNCMYQSFDGRKIAERNHISLSTLRRHIKNSTGYSLHEFVNRLKVAEAKNLLLNTELRVKEVAKMLGYEDIYYFSRLFKKYSGISASDFRSR
jgi:AraC family transcriptional regulator of arabinose operon